MEVTQDRTPWGLWFFIAAAFIGSALASFAQTPATKPATATNATAPAPTTAKPAPPTNPPSQSPSKPGTSTNSAARGPVAPATPAAGVIPPPDYVIGPDDVLTVIVWRDKDLSGDVVVRPDGKISLPLLNDVMAAGLTPEQLRVQLTAAASKLLEEPSVTVVVKAINSRKVYVTGMVNKQGPYSLTGPTTVLQLLTMAGGLLEYADSENIRIMRTENGRPVSFRFNYKEISKGRNLAQDIELKPGDRITVP